MKKNLKHVLGLILAVGLGLSARGSTVTGFLLDPSGATNRVGISFRYIKPGSFAPNFVYTTTKTAWTTNAWFSIVLAAGNYSVQVGPTPDLVPLTVPNDTNTYNLNDLLGTNFVFAYTFSPLYVQRIGGPGGVMSGNLSFSTTNQAGLIANGLTMAQRLALSPTNGMVVYDTTLDQLMRVEGGAWTNFIATAGGGQGSALLLTDTNGFAVGIAARSLATGDTNAFAGAFSRLADTNNFATGVALRSLATGDTNAFAGAFFRLADTNNFAGAFLRLGDTNTFASGIAARSLALTDTNGFAGGIAGRSLAAGDTNAFAGAFFRLADTNAFAGAFSRLADTNNFATGVALRSLSIGDTNAFAGAFFRLADTNNFAAGFFRYADTNTFASGIAARSLALTDTNGFAGAFFRLTDTNNFAGAFLRLGDTNTFASGVALRSLATGDTNAFANSLFRRADTNAFAGALFRLADTNALAQNITNGGNLLFTNSSLNGALIAGYINTTGVVAINPMVAGTLLGTDGSQRMWTNNAGSLTNYTPDINSPQMARTLWRDALVANSGTSETAVSTNTLPANLLAVNGNSIDYWLHGTNNNTGIGRTLTWKVYYGATSLTFGITATTTAIAWEFHISIVRVSASVVDIYAWGQIAGVIQNVVRATDTGSTASTQPLSVTMTSTSQSGDMNLRAGRAQFIP